MKKTNTQKSPALIIGLFLIAILLLLVGTVGYARAALTIRSEEYSSRVEMKDIGVTLVENGTAVASRDYASAQDGSWTGNVEGTLCAGLVPEGEEFEIGRKYDEVLTVRNSGTINEYVRVQIFRYWEDKNGKKQPELDPGLIDLHFTTAGGWLEDPDNNSTTSERNVFYYTSILPAGEETAPLTDTLKINEMIATKVTETTVSKEGKYTVIHTTYDYDGTRFVIEAKVDAVQTHNAADAILSAWGRHVTVDGSGNITSLR